MSGPRLIDLSYKLEHHASSVDAEYDSMAHPTTIKSPISIHILEQMSRLLNKSLKQKLFR